MSSYHFPGVYVETAASGPRPLETVGTSVAAILGTAPLTDSLVGTPEFCTSFTGFRHMFCPPGSDEQADTRPGSNRLAAAVHGFFANGGARCYVLNLGAGAAVVSGTDLEALNALDDISLVLAPGFSDASSQKALTDHCETRGDRMAILDTPATIDPLDRFEVPVSDNSTGLKPKAAPRGLACIYTPWLKIRDPLSGEEVDQPPSGHVAGIFNRVDQSRGVHVAPANVVVRGALGVSRSISHSEQGPLNDACINCIRALPKGICVYGARTLAGPASELLYVPVRRLVTMLEQTVKRGTQWAVFEPNDETLWASIRRDVTAFLTAQWRSGALLGATPEEAFFVKCDAETNGVADIEAGNVRFLIGFAPVKPAEFVIIQISQMRAAAEAEADTANPQT